MLKVEPNLLELPEFGLEPAPPEIFKLLPVNVSLEAVSRFGLSEIDLLNNSALGTTEAALELDSSDAPPPPMLFWISSCCCQSLTSSRVHPISSTNWSGEEEEKKMVWRNFLTFALLQSYNIYTI